MMAGQTASIRIRGGADAWMGWTWFYIFLHTLTVFRGGSGALCLNRRRVWTFGTIVALVLVRRFLLCQSFLFPEFSSTILEPYLEKIKFKCKTQSLSRFILIFQYFRHHKWLKTTLLTPVERMPKKCSIFIIFNRKAFFLSVVYFECYSSSLQVFTGKMIKKPVLNFITLCLCKNIQILNIVLFISAL